MAVRRSIAGRRGIVRRGAVVPLGLLAILLTGAARAADPSFGPEPLATLPGSSAAVVGDFNGDGASDLALVNSTTNDVTILLGSGKGRFTPAGPPIKVGDAPIAVVSSDFNGDGQPDLAVANAGSKSLTILLGNGAGGFTAASGSPIALGGDVGRLKAADLNGDGHVDLVVPVYVNKKWQITILLGDSSARFATATPVARLGRYGADTVAVADFTRDGKADLAVASSEAKGIFVLPGDGAGGFGTARTVSNQTWGGTLVAADLNRDGRPDLVDATLYSDGIAVWLGTGTGAFRPAAGSPIVVAGHPHDVGAADLNGDGKPDLVIANKELGTVSLLLGNGAGRFRQAAFSPFSASLLGDVSPALAGVADFNGDGKPDLLMVSRLGTTVLFQTPAAPPVVQARAAQRPDEVLSIHARVTLLAADGNRAAVATSVKHGCGRIVVWTAPGRRSTSVKPGFLGCSGDGVSQLAVGAGRVAWIEEGGGNNLEMTVMAAKLGGGAAKQIEYESNGDRAGGDPTGDWVGQLFGGSSLLAYNSWTQTCDRPPDTQCGDYDPFLRITGQQLVGIRAGRRTVVVRGPGAYPLKAIGGGRMAVEAVDGVTIRAATGAVVATVLDPDRSDRAVALSKTRLAIERTFTLDLYNPATAASAKSLPLGPAAALRLVDVNSKLALLRGPRRLVLVRLSDGKLISFPLGARAIATLVGAKLTETGLFYAYNTRSTSLPGRIVFEPTRKLLRRF
jgi:FG-GAP-like repeat